MDFVQGLTLGVVGEVRRIAKASSQPQLKLPLIPQCASQSRV